jgi:hypothetical protein
MYNRTLIDKLVAEDSIRVYSNSGTIIIVACKDNDYNLK